MVVSEELQKRARELICPPSPQKRISEVGNAKKGEILTVVGQVVKVSTFYTKQGKNGVWLADYSAVFSERSIS